MAAELDGVHPIQLRWKDLNYKVTIRETGFAALRKKLAKKPVMNEERTILNDVSGVVEPGSMLAIMGPSGCGKTTLLNTLSLRLGAKFSGDVLVNGSKADPDVFRKVAGYVPQEDILMGSQTVREALQFYAKLKLPVSVSETERNTIVEHIISELGLKKVSDSLIGYVGADAATSGLNRGLSGGERKRLNIGLQLIINPSLLFLDEPTTGLDSFAAYSVIKTLSRLSQQGRTIVFTIHQPSAEIMALFENILLLARGHSVYFGPNDQALDYFKKIGFKCPAYENPGDFFLRIINTAPKERDPKQRTKTLKVIFEDKENIDRQAAELAESFQNSELVHYMTDAKPPPPEVSKERAKGKQRRHGFFTQVQMLLLRTFRNMFREPQAARAGMGQIAVIAIIMGLIYLQQDHSQSSIQNRLGALFFANIFLMFSSLLGAFYLFPTERKVFLSQYADGLYSTFPYYVAKVLGEIPVYLTQVLIFSVIFYFMLGLKTSAEAFFTYYLFAAMTSLTAFAYGIMIILILPDPALALNVFPVFLLPQFFFSGFYLNGENTPVYFIWAPYISWVRYTFRGFVINEFSGQTFDCTADDLALSNGVCRFRTGEDVLSFWDMDTFSLYNNAAVLVAFIVGLHCLNYFMLRRSSKRI